VRTSCHSQEAAALALAELEAKLKKDFKVQIKNFCMQAAKIDWSSLSAELNLGLKLPADRAIEPMDLWDADMGKVLKQVFIDADPTGTAFGPLPQMATTSRGSIGAFLAASFCESINSAANQVVTKGSTLLSDAEVNMLVVLRVNRRFMAYMREHHPEVPQQQFQKTVLCLAEIKDDGDSA